MSVAVSVSSQLARAPVLIQDETLSPDQTSASSSQTTAPPNNAQSPPINNSSLPLPQAPAGPETLAALPDSAQKPPSPKLRDLNPVDSSSYFSILSFWWINSILSVGSKRPLEEEDMPELPQNEDPSIVHSMFITHWKDELSKGSDASLLLALYRSFGWRWWVGGLAHILSAAATILTPFLVNFLLTHLEAATDPEVPDETQGLGYLYAFGLTLATLFNSIMLNHMFYHVVRMGSNVRMALMTEVYCKSLRLSSSARQGSSTGETVNVMSTDAQRIFEACTFIHFLWVCPLTILVVLILLVILMGPSAYAGVALMILLLPLQSFLGKKIGLNRRAMLKHTDERVKVVNEIMSGIRVVKYYGWEDAFEKRVEGIRARELDNIRSLLYMKAVNLCVLFVWPSIAAFFMFALYIFLGNEMKVSKVFTIMAFMNTMRFPISLIPMALTAVVEGRVSLRRIRSFLVLPELDDYVQRAAILEDKPSAPEPALAAHTPAVDEPMIELQPSNAVRISLEEEADQNCVITLLPSNQPQTQVLVPSSAAIVDQLPLAASIRNGQFSWRAGSGTPLLKNINMQIPHGALVAVVGPVGSGKSSLLAAILGEMFRQSGSVQIDGRLSYLSQSPWIRNTSVRDNITMGLRFDPVRYHACVRAAALEPDLQILPNGHETEIGERGINLSGGQKARISFARILYRINEADLFVLDDPLSAVDVHVARQMFYHGIVDFLRDKTRIMVLNAHMEFLKHFDMVIVMGPTDEPPANRRADSPELKVAELEATEIKSDNSPKPSLTKRVSNVFRRNQSSRPAANANADSCSRRNSNSNRDGYTGTIVDFGAYEDLISKYPALLQAPDQDHQDSDPAAASHSLLTVAAPSMLEAASASAAKADEKQLGAAKPAAKKGLIEAEDRAYGAVNRESYARYFGASGIYSSCPSLSGLFTLATVLFLFAAGQVARVLSDWWLAIWSSHSVFNLSNRVWLLTFGSWVAATLILVLLRSFLFTNVLIRSSRSMHSSMLSRLLHAPITTFFDVTPLGRIVNRFSSDMDKIDILAPDFLGQLLQNVFHLSGCLILCVVASPWFAICCVAIFIFFHRFQTYFRASSRELKRIEGVLRSPMFSLFGETLTGLPTIRALSIQDQMSARFRSYLQRNSRVFFMMQMATRWLALRLDFVSFCIITGVSFLVVATASANTDLSALALMYSLQFIGSLQWTVRLFIDTETNMTSVERVHHYSTIPQEAPSEIEGSVPSEEWPKEGAIEFNNLKIRYRPELDLVLKGVTAKIKPREKIGICGRTGAGKSSLMVALFRIVEAELDNESPAAPITIDGVDISRVGLRDLRKHLSIIPQDPVLFSGTVRYNLDPFDEYTDAQLWQALRDVHLVDTIQGLPHQLSHVVSEFGDNFSHGQRQLICIARALLRRSRIVVMDEATASVDAATDQLIQQTIRELFRDCTVLTVAHRLDTIIQCDRIMVLDSGRILEFDTPAQLLASDQSVFREMVSRTGADMQKKLYAAANL